MNLYQWFKENEYKPRFREKFSTRLKRVGNVALASSIRFDFLGIKPSTESGHF